jgi:hypothetical protein
VTNILLLDLVDPFLPSSSTAPFDSFPSISSDFASTKEPTNQNSSVNSDSQYASQDQELLRLSVDVNASLDRSFVVSNHSQMRHLGQFSVPKLLRDDFIVLTRVSKLKISFQLFALPGY